MLVFFHISKRAITASRLFLFEELSKNVKKDEETIRLKLDFSVESEIKKTNRLKSIFYYYFTSFLYWPYYIQSCLRHSFKYRKDGGFFPLLKSDMLMFELLDMTLETTYLIVFSKVSKASNDQSRRLLNCIYAVFKDSGLVTVTARGSDGEIQDI